MVKINFNDAALRHIAQHRAPDREGRLLYRMSKDSYRERWFRLCGNLLFYFRMNERGAGVDVSGPVGVLVLAECHVQVEKFGDQPFVFSVTFSGEEGRKHFFVSQTKQQCVQWVQALRECGHSELQSQLEALRLQIKELSGMDPLPLSERNKIPKSPRSGLVESAGAASAFYVGLSSSKQSASTTRPTVPARQQPIVPTRQAPSRPTQQLIELQEPEASTNRAQHERSHPTQPLVELLEPEASTDTAKVHTAASKAATFSNWESFS